MLKLYCSDIPVLIEKPFAKNLEQSAHVYCICIGGIDLSIHAHLISDQEKAKANLFRQTADAKRFLAGKIFTKKILSRYIQVAPESIAIAADKNKKPFATHKGKLVPFHFNISHSEEMLLLAISEKNIGVDVEAIKAIQFKEIVEQSFSKAEQSFLQNSGQQLSHFYKFWTRKEAILKAVGTGIIDNLNDLEVLDGFNSNRLFAEKNYDFEVVSFSPGNGYQAGVCVELGVSVIFISLND